MKFIDFSDLYFRSIAKAALPACRRGKFVHMEYGDDEYLVLSPVEFHVYHAMIVERFCSLHGIEGQYDRAKHAFNLYDAECAVLGGGVWLMDDERRIFRISGVSQVYGSFDRPRVLQALKTVGRLRGYEIECV